MTNSINGAYGQSFKGVNVGNTKTRGPSEKTNSNKQTSKLSKQSDVGATLELSKDYEMYGKVVDMLQKKYENADVFVAGPNDDTSLIGGDLEYSIILSEDEMKLLASEDHKDKEAKDKLLGQIDDAMNKISEMSKKIEENSDEKDDIANFGLSVDKSGKINFFADINGNKYSDTALDSLVKAFVADKA